MATQAEIDKIRAMQEKGTITAEQADELIAALSQDDADSRGAGESTPAHDEETHDRERSRHRGRHSHRRRWMPGWVEDLAEGFGAGSEYDCDEYDPDSGRYDYWYRYSWDPSDFWRRFGKNAQGLSRVERPEGEDFTFQDNKFAFSRVHSIHLVRSTMKNNAFKAATVQHLEMEDGTLLDSSFAGASLHDVTVKGAEMKNVDVSGAKVKGLSLRDGSTVADSAIAGGYVHALELSRQSRLAGAHLQGMKLHEIRLAASTANDLTVRNAGLHDWEIEDSTLSGCRIENIGMQDVKVKKSVLTSVVFRQETEGSFTRVQDLGIEDCDLDGCEFIECRIRDTRFKGITAKGLVIRGKDLTGLRLEKTEDLAALAEK
jgi:uncharacterized protein YjbI with pentapeptide repeats